MSRCIIPTQFKCESIIKIQLLECKKLSKPYVNTCETELTPENYFFLSQNCRKILYDWLEIKPVSSMFKLSFWVKNYIELNPKHLQIHFPMVKTVAFLMSEMVKVHYLGEQLTINFDFCGHFSTLRAENATKNEP